MFLIRGNGDRAAIAESLETIQDLDRMPAADVVRFTDARPPKIEASDCMKAFKRMLKNPRASLVVDNPLPSPSSWRTYLDVCESHSDRHFRIYGIETGEPNSVFGDDVELITAEQAVEILKEHAGA